MPSLRPLLALSALLLSGCIGGNLDAPSLRQRDYEHETVPVPDAASEPAAALSPALQARIAALLDQAKAADAGFQQAHAKAGALIARAAGAPAGSEAWTAAQQELGALDTALGPVQSIESEVDGLRADPINATPANRAAIDAAAQTVQALADQEHAAARALSEKLKS